MPTYPGSPVTAPTATTQPPIATKWIAFSGPLYSPPKSPVVFNIYEILFMPCAWVKGHGLCHFCLNPYSDASWITVGEPVNLPHPHHQSLSFLIYTMG